MNRILMITLRTWWLGFWCTLSGILISLIFLKRLKIWPHVYFLDLRIVITLTRNHSLDMLAKSSLEVQNSYSRESSLFQDHHHSLEKSSYWGCLVAVTDFTNFEDCIPLPWMQYAQNNLAEKLFFTFDSFRLTIAENVTNALDSTQGGKNHSLKQCYSKKIFHRTCCKPGNMFPYRALKCI